jgi:Rhodanese-related sulfurtransferase
MYGANDSLRSIKYNNGYMKFKTLLFSLLATIVLAACCSDKSAIESLSAEEFELKLQKASNPQLVDVRTPDEFNESHIAGALNIDVNGAEFEESIVATIDKGKPVFVYCKGGNRSMKAAAILETQGYKPIYNLAGGITEWKEKEKPTKSDII